MISSGNFSRKTFVLCNVIGSLIRPAKEAYKLVGPGIHIFQPCSIFQMYNRKKRRLKRFQDEVDESNFSRVSFSFRQEHKVHLAEGNSSANSD